MKTNRKTFLKTVGAFVAGLGLVKANAQPSVKAAKFQRVVLSSSRSRKRQFAKGTLLAGPQVTFILDIPNHEVKVKGLYRAEDCELRAVGMAHLCYERKAKDGTVVGLEV